MLLILGRKLSNDFLNHHNYKIQALVCPVAEEFSNPHHNKQKIRPGMDPVLNIGLVMRNPNLCCMLTVFLKGYYGDIPEKKNSTDNKNQENFSSKHSVNAYKCCCVLISWYAFLGLTLI